MEEEGKVTRYSVNTKKRMKLYIDGRNLADLILEELNKVDVHGAYHSFRRQEDMEEVCVALALLAEFLELNIESLRRH